MYNAVLYAELCMCWPELLARTRGPPGGKLQTANSASHQPRSDLLTILVVVSKVVNVVHAQHTLFLFRRSIFHVSYRNITCIRMSIQLSSHKSVTSVRRMRIMVGAIPLLHLLGL
jgi:hypothetical protein